MTALARSAYAPYVARIGREPSPITDDYTTAIDHDEVWVADRAETLEQKKPEYYVRRDGTTFYARPEELAAVVQRDSPPSGSLPWFAK
ncbi:MAG: hypothetical protein ACYCZM_13050 [Acidimicrobiales bacterium]